MTPGQRQLLATPNLSHFCRTKAIAYPPRYQQAKAKEHQQRLWLENRTGPEAFYWLDRFGDANINQHMVFRHRQVPGT